MSEQARNKTALSSRLLLRLFAAFLLVAFAGVAVAAFLVDRNVRKTMLTEVEDRLSYQSTMLGQMTANALFGPLDASDASLNGAVHKLGAAVHTQLSLIAPDGRVAADSDVDAPQSLPSQVDAPEIVQARARGRGTSVRGADGDSRMFVARAIVQDGVTLGFARSSLSMNVVRAQVHEVRVRMAMGALTAGFVALLLGFFVSTRVTRPIRALTEGAGRIGEGELDTVIRVDSRDEIGDLAEAFNRMTRNLRQTISALDSRNGEMRLVLDNINQGLLVIDRDGVMARERSASIDEWFGPVPPKTTLWAYLAPHDATLAKMLRLGWQAVCDGFLPLELTLDQLPKLLGAVGREFELGYQPIFDGDRLSRALVVVSDVTERRKAEAMEGEQREFLAVLDRVLRDRSGFTEFLREARVIVLRLESDASSLTDVLRDLHTLRGNASVVGLTRLAEICRELETAVSGTGERPAPAALAALVARWRVLEQRFENVLDERAQSEQLEVDRAEHAALLQAMERGAQLSELVRRVREWQLEPVQRRLCRFAEHARGLAQRLGKGELRVRVEAEGVRLERARFQAFWAAFMHVLRNAVDHGIERPSERAARGKPACGQLVLRATKTQHEVRIDVEDDGQGVDWDALEARARTQGLSVPRREELLFVDGLSSRAQADDVSGRGIGMGAVRAACRALGGDVSITSSLGVSTLVRFTLPLADAPRVSKFSSTSTQLVEQKLKTVGKDA
ncbi:MAG TPA: HAMP domain-containing protein [Polyangiaceae bacterium]|jgi:two-component system chemotaxis sensor kinase CheA